MNAMQAALIFATVAVAGAAPFIAVHRGGSVYEFGDDPEPEPAKCADDTAQIPRIVVDDNDPYMY